MKLANAYFHTLNFKSTLIFFSLQFAMQKRKRGNENVKRKGIECK